MNTAKLKLLLVDCGSRYIENLVSSLKTTYITRIKIEKISQSDLNNKDGIVISGSPTLITQIDPSLLLEKTKLCLSSNLPILGVCMGHQLIGMCFGGEISLGEARMGKEQIEIIGKSKIFNNIKTTIFMHEAHREEITLPKGFILAAYSNRTKVEAIEHKIKPVYGLQFHPEKSGAQGQQIIDNFIEIIKKPSVMKTMIPYLQTTPFTCAASSLLTILHHFKKTSLTKENEFDIWQKTVLLPTRASSIFALASYAKNKGLVPKVIVENPCYDFPDYRFYRYKKEDIELASFNSNLHLNKAKKNQVIIEERNINFSDLKKETNENFLLIRINTKPIRNEKRNTSNFIIIQSYKNNYFQIIDPKLGGLSIPESIMQEAFETLETKKYRDHKMILFPK